MLTKTFDQSSPFSLSISSHIKCAFIFHPLLHCQRLLSAFIIFTTLSQLVFNALDLLFGMGHSQEWRFPDTAAKVAVVLPTVYESGCYQGSLYKLLVILAVGGWVASDKSDCHPPHINRCQIYIMAHHSVQVLSPYDGNWNVCRHVEKSKFTHVAQTQQPIQRTAFFLQCSLTYPFQSCTSVFMKLLVYTLTISRVRCIFVE